jgi:SnoaL-like domain
MTSRLEEKDAIREVLAEYCFRLDNDAFAEMAALFTEHGVWETAFGTAKGRGAIAALAGDIRARFSGERPRAVHLVANVRIALEGERARVRSNWILAENSRQGPRLGSGGAYEDEMAKEGGRWLFRRRKIDRFLAP